MATVGSDYHRYFEWLEKCGIGTDDLRVVAEELTAGAYITTDLDGNQITGFNPGAMKQQAGFSYEGIDPANVIAIVAPGNIQDMIEFTARHHELGIYTIFDPGQSLPLWDPQDLANCIEQSNMLICNDYELGMVSNATGLARPALVGMVEHLVVTRGEQGAELHSRGITGNGLCDSHRCHRPDRGRRRLPRWSDQGSGQRRRDAAGGADGRRLRVLRGAGERHPDIQLHPGRIRPDPAGTLRLKSWGAGLHPMIP